MLNVIRLSVDEIGVCPPLYTNMGLEASTHVVVVVWKKEVQQKWVCGDTYCFDVPKTISFETGSGMLPSPKLSPVCKLTVMIVVYGPAAW